MDGLKVFSGSSHPALAQEICQCLGLPMGTISTRLENGPDIDSHPPDWPTIQGAQVTTISLRNMG